MKIPKPKRRKKVRIPREVSLKDQCDVLWSACIHARAGERSELSLQTGVLHAHHIIHKPNYRLRFELENGILLTSHEHIHGVHGVGAEEYREKIVRHIGKPKWDWLRSLRFGSQKTDLGLVKIYLQSKLKEYGK